MALESPRQGWEPLLRRAREGLVGALGRHGIDPTPGLADGEKFDLVWQRLSTYLDLVVAWNRRMDLTAARSAEELVDLSLADAAVVASATGSCHGAGWLEVGSGAGAPGLPIAFLREGDRVLLVEPKEKRVAFLRSVIGQLGMSAVGVRRGRSDALPEGAAEVAVSRATLPPAEWLREGARLASRVWVLLARDPPPQEPGLRMVRDLTYAWPLTGVTRRAVAYERQGAF